MKVGVEGDEQSHAKVKADFRKDPGMVKLSASTDLAVDMN